MQAALRCVIRARVTSLRELTRGRWCPTVANTFYVRLAAAAALWQERARVLEGQLLALGAGDVAPLDDQAWPAPTVAAVPWWRRLWGG